MRLYEIFIPEFDSIIKFKALQPGEVTEFVISLSEIEEDDYIKAVLSHFIFNIKTDIKPSLKKMSKECASNSIKALYNGCVFINPGLDIEKWIEMSYLNTRAEEFIKKFSQTDQLEKDNKSKTTRKRNSISRKNIVNLEEELNLKVIGQSEAVAKVSAALRRSLAGFNDAERPVGVFLLAGSSGVGKTFLAKNLHEKVYGTKSKLARIDCGEYQEKHQALTLLGAPPSYVGYDEEKGGILSQILEEDDAKVLLLDEVEKAHKDLWNLFLRIFDEGKVTDSRGKVLDFTKVIIIMTTNLGNDEVVKNISGKSAGFHSRIEEILETTEMPDHKLVEKEAKKAIKNHFKTEFLNRIDDIVVFRHLHPTQYKQIAEQEIALVASKLKSKGMSAIFDDSAVEGLVAHGVNTLNGARGMSRVRRSQIESALADMIINLNLKRGTKFSVSYDNLEFDVDVAQMPKARVRKKV